MLVVVWFYSIVSYLIETIWLHTPHTWTGLASSLIPILSKKYWFITIYIILYILSPCLNKLALSISKNHFKSILFIGFFIIYVWHTLSFILNFNRPIDDAGYGIPNFIYLYLLGRYIKLHGNIYTIKQNILLLYFIICMSLFTFQLTYSIILGFSFTALFSYNTIFVFLGSVALFLFFAKLNIGYNSFINKWAKYCLAVYVIHTNADFFAKLYEFSQVSQIPPIWFIPYSLLISTIMYFAFALVEQVRLYFFDKIENIMNNRIMQTEIAQNIEYRIKLTA